MTGFGWAAESHSTASSGKLQRPELQFWDKHRPFQTSLYLTLICLFSGWIPLPVLQTLSTPGSPLWSPGCHPAHVELGVCAAQWWYGQGRSYGGSCLPPNRSFYHAWSPSPADICPLAGEKSVEGKPQKPGWTHEGRVHLLVWLGEKLLVSPEADFLYSDHFFISCFHFWESLDFSKLPVKRRTWPPQSKRELCHLHQWSWNVTAKAGWFPRDWFHANIDPTGDLRVCVPWSMQLNQCPPPHA